MRQHTLNVSLTPALAGLIREKVDSGSYHSASEVVRDALRLLIERDRRESRRLEALVLAAKTKDGAVGNLKTGLALYESGIEILKQNFLRDNPEASNSELSSYLDHWIEAENLSDQVGIDLRESPNRLKRLRGE